MLSTNSHYEDKWDKDKNVTSCPANIRNESSNSTPVALDSSDDALCCYSEVSFDGDANKEKDVNGGFPCCITLPTPHFPPMLESRWSTSITSTTIDYPPMYSNIHRKRQRHAEPSCCALRDVPFRAPTRSSEWGEILSSSTRCPRPQRLAGICIYRRSCHSCIKHEHDAISLYRLIDILNASLDIVNDEANL
jgi:hypothetical protein